MVLITIVTGAYKPTNITGGPHIVRDLKPSKPWSFAPKTCRDLFFLPITAHPKQNGTKDNLPLLVGGIPTPLKNDGVRQLGS